MHHCHKQKENQQVNRQQRHMDVISGLWASSYLALFRGYTAETAAEYAALFYMGITGGRALSGFVKAYPIM